MSATYRFAQGIRALGAWFRPVDDDLARAHLTPALYALYQQMRRSERQHSLRVLQDLLNAGHTHPDLLTAALLHDVGKSRVPFTLPEKMLVVLVKACVPKLYQQWSNSSAHSWRRPFVVSVQHPAWGAEMVAEIGGSPLAITLIRRHDDPPTDASQDDTARLLTVLYAADNRN
ncbi:MAG: HD domain-containing protein [Anaerolineae bacterium]|nr:HD domain-containing protein [Anaerolineae bacterium]